MSVDLMFDYVIIDVLSFHEPSEVIISAVSHTMSMYFSGPCVCLCVQIVNYTLDSCNVRLSYHDGLDDFNPSVRYIAHYSIERLEMVSYCDRPLSVVVRRPSCVNLFT